MFLIDPNRNKPRMERKGCFFFLIDNSSIKHILTCNIDVKIENPLGDHIIYENKAL